MLRRSATAWKNRAPEATLPLLFTLLIYSLAPTLADAQPLEFRHGVSQIPSYELKYPVDFPHFNYVNADAPKGGTLVLPAIRPLNTVSPMYRPGGFFRSYDHLIERAGDEPSGYYGSLAESIALSHDRRRIVFRLRPEAAGMTAGRLPQPTSNLLSTRFAPTSWARICRGALLGYRGQHPGSAAGRGRQERAVAGGPGEGGAAVAGGLEAAAGPPLAAPVQAGGDRGGRRLTPPPFRRLDSGRSAPSVQAPERRRPRHRAAPRQVSISMPRESEPRPAAGRVPGSRPQGDISTLERRGHF